MKRLIVVIGALGLFSGAAVAGGCSNGSHAALDTTDKLPVIASAEQTDPALLALLEKQRAETEALENLLELPVTYN